MKVIVNIECRLGEEAVLDHMTYMLNTLCVNTKDITYSKVYNDSYFYIIDNVNKEIYKDTINSIIEHFNKLYAKGKIYYFYMGEYKPR